MTLPLRQFPVESIVPEHTGVYYGTAESNEVKSQ